MKLIDADELIYMTLSEDTEKPFRFVPLEFIEDAPIIDAVPVIRCKDCVHFKRSEVLGNTCALTDNHVTKKDYCSKAERKEE